LLRELTEATSLPLRPLTTGELLDAAVVLLRIRAFRLVGLGALLSLGEQVLLFVLRRRADVDASFLPGTGRLAQYGVLIVAGLAAEAFCIAVLGGVAAGVGPRALLGQAAPPLRSRPAAVVVVAAYAGLICAAAGTLFLVLPGPLQLAGAMLAGLATLVIWPFAYGFVGLAAPAVVIDGYGPLSALGRSARLAGRIGIRAAAIRVLGYSAWLVIRLGIGLGALAAVNLFYSSPSATIDDVLMGAAWLITNCIAYPMLGCLDVALHMETRMRTEGLDIALHRIQHRGVTAAKALAVPR
jgi:hypothetical protein